MTIEFQAWPKTTRLFRDITITEKIDGTNACIIFEPVEFDNGVAPEYNMACQSRNKLITPGKTTDNAGFAQWAYDNADELFAKLGYGRHYGEWWGQKIARKYGMDHKVFSIFNVDLWDVQEMASIKYAIGDAWLTHTPVLYRGQFSEAAIMECAGTLKDFGSTAAYRFGIDGQEPEGICIYHSQTRMVQKFTFDNNDAGKWEHL